MKFKTFDNVFYLLPSLLCWVDEGRLTLAVAFWCFDVEITFSVGD